MKRSYLKSLAYTASGVAIALLLQGGAIGQEYHEAPALAEMVAAGKLPPVEERLPAKPPVVPVLDSIGTYGGVWDEYIGGPGEEYKLPIAGAYEHLVRWSPDFSEVLPNIAESWDINEDATEFTFHLVQGIKWSDGEPFGADDIVFAVNDVLNNPELSPAGPPSWLSSKGTPATVEKIDDNTVKFTFANTQALFLQRLAQVGGHLLTHFPKHYLEQFHATYNPDGIAALASEAGFATWPELFLAKRAPNVWANNPEIPVLTPWMVTSSFADGGTQLVLDRNPYYWKVDAEGNQLPYIDQQVFHVIQDVELTSLAMMNGDIDSLMMGDDASEVLTNKSLFADNAEAGNYHLVDVFYPGPFRVVGINLTFPDPVKGPILANKDFRVGMSQAINRQEVIDLLYFGVGEPYQSSPAAGSKFYDEEFTKQYTEYDVEAANASLDKVLPEKDAEGFRLMADGNRFTITFDMIARPDDVDLFEILVQQWATVGIEAHINATDRSLRNARMSGNQSEGFTYGGAEGTFNDELMDPRWFVPVTGSSFWAIGWADWYLSGGAKGTEPPAEVKGQMDLYTEALGTSDPAKRDELIKQMFDFAKEQFYLIGTNTRAGGYSVVSNDLKNVPNPLISGPSYFRVAPANPATFYLDEAD